jgi:glutamyl-tRNA synthetase
MDSDLPSPKRTRFAPSPTGRLHIGGARTALYSYLLAQQSGGQFILRIEDTDQKRFVPGAEDEIKESLRWMGILWDEGPDVGGPFGPYRQSERKAIYQEHANQLVQSGHAYPCFCSPQRLSELRQIQQKRKEPTRYDGLCRRLSNEEASERVLSGESHVIRFKTPREGRTEAVDHLVGTIVVENEQLDDYILIKSDGVPVYHLAVVVDDHRMAITHAMRSAEWLPTFPLHVLLYQAFGWEQPVWIHPSVLLNPSGKGKMSKRDQAQLKGGAQAIYPLDMRDFGYLPEAVNNWLALMGWSYDDRTEFFSMTDLIEKFSLEKMSPSAAAVNYSKLDHFNGLHIRNLSIDELTERVKPFFDTAGVLTSDSLLKRIVPLIQDRIRTLDEAVSMAGFFFQDEVHPIAEELVGKGMSIEESIAASERTLQTLSDVDSFLSPALESNLRSLADEMALKPGQLFGILRVAVTGQKVSPPLFESMEIIGREKTMLRITHATKLLRGLASRGHAP